jgi:hypothetical protein
MGKGFVVADQVQYVTEDTLLVKFNEINKITLSALPGQGPFTIDECGSLFVEAAVPSFNVNILRSASILLGNDTEQSILVARVTRDSGIWSGQRLVIQAGGCRKLVPDLPGGELRLSGGISTGTRDSIITFYTSTAASDTSPLDNIPTEKMRITGSLIRTLLPLNLAQVDGGNVPDDSVSLFTEVEVGPPKIVRLKAKFEDGMEVILAEHQI